MDEPQQTPVIVLEPIKSLASFEPSEEIIPGLLDDGIVIIGAVEGSGKTFLGIMMGAIVSAGAPWKGKRVNKGLVVYCIAEGVSFFPYRVTTAFDKLGYRASDQPFYVLRRSINLRCDEKGLPNPEVVALMNAIVAAETESKQKCRLIIFDTLNRFMPGGDENAQVDAGALIHGCEWLRDQLNCAIVLMHHMKKDGTMLRGSTVLTAAADQVLVCDADRDQLTEVPICWTTKGIGKRKDRDPVEQWVRYEKEYMSDGNVVDVDDEWNMEYEHYVYIHEENEDGLMVSTNVPEQTLVVFPAEPPSDDDLKAISEKVVSEILAYLAENGDVGVSTLMRALRRSQKTVYKALDGLQRQGTITRDMKSKKYRLAPKSSGNPFADGQLS